MNIVIYTKTNCPHSAHNGYRHPVESAKLIECERIMRELASWLGCGGYNSDEFIPSEFEAKIRHGIEHLHPPVVPVQEPVAWKNAAIRLGEELSSVGPDGYYDMTAEQWLDWAMTQQPRGKNSLPAAQPDIQRLSALVRAQQITIDKLEEKNT